MKDGDFGVDAIGLTGTEEDSSTVARQFGAQLREDPHLSIFGLDAKGQTRLLIDCEASVDLVVKEIRALLAA